MEKTLDKKSLTEVAEMLAKHFNIGDTEIIFTCMGLTSTNPFEYRFFFDVELYYEDEGVALHRYGDPVVVNSEEDLYKAFEKIAGKYLKGGGINGL